MKFIVISIYVSFIIKLILGSTSSSSSIKLVSFHKYAVYMYGVK